MSSNKQQQSGQARTASFTTVGANVSAKMEGDMLILAINLRDEVGVSKSGKSLNIATTNGNKSIRLPDGRTGKLGVNLFVAQAESPADLKFTG